MNNRATLVNTLAAIAATVTFVLIPPASLGATPASGDNAPEVACGNNRCISPAYCSYENGRYCSFGGGPSSCSNNDCHQF